MKERAEKRRRRKERKAARAERTGKAAKAGKQSRVKEVIIGLLVAVLALGIGCVIYINDDYRASEEAMAMIETPASEIHLIVDEEGRMIFEPEEATAGVIFYPGGKVEAESYAPLLSALAKEGILSVLVPMPANLAVLDVDAAEGIVEHYGDVENWYMAGHSLGGSMAASYLSEQTDSDYFKGLILLAAYSTEDFSATDLNVLTIYGDQDKVLNKDKYEKNYINLPVDYTREEVIKGGNHAQFGDYGVQDGDGKAKISAKEQVKQTVKAIKEFIGE